MNFSLFTLTQNSPSLTPEQVENLVNSKLLDSVDGINSAVSNSLETLAIVIALFTLFVGYSFFQRKQIAEKVLSEVQPKLYKIKKEFEEESSETTAKHIKRSIKYFREQVDTEEFYRNILISDLYNILAYNLDSNNPDNLKEVYSKHVDYMMIVAQLTSGITKQTTRALKKLSNGSYKSIEDLDSFKAYLRLLEKSDDMEIIMELENYKSKRGSLSHSSLS